jgi:hypothetical protein
MIEIISRRIEIFFWDSAISLLSSSEGIRAIIRHLFQFKKMYIEGVQIFFGISISGFIGLVAGFSLQRIFNIHW